MARAPTLLLTGATGLIGRLLAERLRNRRPDLRLLLLTRCRERIAPHFVGRGVEIVEGDITNPGLGLDREQLRRLEADVTEVIHCAADTRFGLPLETARASNVTGTTTMLEIARRCCRLEKFAHVSTAYVAGRTPGRIASVYRAHDNGYVNTYQQSKHEAEKRVVEMSGEVPSVIFRFSSLVGHSRTGVVEQFNYVHQLIKLLPRNPLPVVPADPGAPVDLVATDVAVDTFTELYESNFIPGQVHQICAGAERSMTVRQVIDRTVAIFNGHPKARRWLPLRVPELIPTADFERFIERRLTEHDDPLLRELLRVTSFFLPHLAIRQEFDHDRFSAPPIAEVYDKVVAYCIDTNWGVQRGGGAISTDGSKAITRIDPISS